MRNGSEQRRGQGQNVSAALLSRIGLVGFGVMATAAPVQAAAELVLIPSPFVLISLLVLFVALIFPLNALIFRPIFDTLDERLRRTAGAREQSEEVSRRADDVLQRYRSELQAARAAAERTRRESVEQARTEQARLTAVARTDAQQKLEQGRSELSAALEQARADLETHARDLAGAAAQRILGRAL